MQRAWFVTGTDTGVGKTLVSVALLTALARSGRRVVGMKPVASGCDTTPHGLRSADAEALLGAGNVAADNNDLNPYALAAPTAPHLAAAVDGVQIDIATIRAHFARLAAHADDVVVEGIGGWLVPINRTQTMADVARTLELPVILVVGMRLGCLNHALLTERAITASGCRLVAWVANTLECTVPDGYVEALADRLDAPCLGVIPSVSSAALAADSLDLSVIDD
ncbi:MAG: Dethiobiotin synthetase [Proteobacteria bacterium]|nr:Dethiobiotin synthetase [Pseudomonadota bacterium]